ncbi:tetratricopeptide repeat protein [Patescibacteria group bacterium]|nr:tetratricopeptide repeat protein [Patescibacteria group bacterium]MBU1705458.1 tetratricopeptide repeat protein [Patescibacteria group bacterium]
MNKSRTRFLITLIAVIVIAAVGYFWWQQSQINPYGQREIVTWVDRGLDDDVKQYFLDEIETQKQALTDSEAAGQADISIILQLGNLYYQMGELATSIEYYDRILKDHSTDAPALENKGQSLYEMGDFAGAEQNWLKALESNQYELTYIRLAKIYNEDLPERQAEVKDLMETAIVNLGQQKSLLLILGHWYRDNGYVDEAISHYEIVLKLDPGNKDVQKEIDRLREQKNRELQRQIKD